MKEEIKEILDNLKYTAKKHTIQVLENGGKIEHCPQEIATEMRLNSYSANILLDYITNLQEEVNKLTAESTEWEERTYCWQDRAENLEIIIDKAIEYIRENDDFYYGDELYDGYKEIINILKGDKDE